MKTYTLAARRELRFLVPAPEEGQEPKSTGHIFLKSGTAEIFGRDLRLKEHYSLPQGSYAIYTWYGCSVELDEELCDKIHLVEDTHMDLYAGVHGNLELLRDNRQNQEKGGPRVAVVGPERSGKSTVCKILTAYAARCDRKPAFVDLDITNNSLSIPGTITATKLQGHKDIDAAVGILTKGALTYFTGCIIPGEDSEIFLGAVQSLGRALDARFQNDKTDCSGVIVDTFPLNSDNEAEYKLMLTALKILKVDVVLVIGQDRLSQELRNELSGCQVIKLPAPGDSIKRPEKSALHLESVRKYFEGSPLLPFQPCRKVIVNMDKFHVYTLHNKAVVDSAILPIGQVSVIEPKNYTKMDVDASLEKCVLGISYAETENDFEDPNQMKNVAGFVYVEKVDKDSASGTTSVHLLTPCNAEIPGSFFIKGSLHIHEM